MSEPDPQPPASEGTTIRVNGETVPAELIRREEDLLRRRYAETVPEAELDAMAAQIAEDARQNAIERILLLQTARSVVGPVAASLVEARLVQLKRQYGGTDAFPESMGVSPADEARIREGIEDDLRLERYFEELCRDVPRPTIEECRADYEANRDRFRTPETIWAKHIVRRPAPDEPAAQVFTTLLNLRERIVRGEDISALAREHSDCHDDGDLGTFARGQMVESFDRVVFSLPAGAVSDVFPTEFGYHIVKVLDRRPEGVRPFTEARREIDDRLWTDRKNARIGEVVDGLRAGARIETQ
jgi:parvulin-like peptidyl-prolyl isomerase